MAREYYKLEVSHMGSGFPSPVLALFHICDNDTEDSVGVPDVVTSLLGWADYDDLGVDPSEDSDYWDWDRVDAWIESKVGTLPTYEVVW